MGTKSGQSNSKGNKRGISPASLANLKKGGRTPGTKNWDTLLSLAGISEDDDIARIKAMYEVAQDKDHPGFIKANELLNDRRFGKVPQQLTGDADHPLGIILNTTIPGTGNNGKRS